MNLVFIGSSQFGLRCLETCLSLPDIRVTGVLTAPNFFRISYRPEGVTNVLYADLASFAKARFIPLEIMHQSMSQDGLLTKVTEWQPDAFLVAGWYHMIPKSWRQLAPAFGLHASLLPDYSGGAPLVWAMINNETRTGITLFQMADGVDSGPIVAQKDEDIFPEDTIASLYARVQEKGLELLKVSLPRIAKGKLNLIPQDESKRRIMPQRSPQDGLIDWRGDFLKIDRFIRAQTRPYPGAFTILNGKILHIWQAKTSEVEFADEVGTVFCQFSVGYFVRCGKGSIQLIEVSYESEIYKQSRLSELFGQGGQKLVTV